MLILLKAWTDDDWLDPQANCATLKINEELVAQILKRMDDAALSKKRDNHFSTTQYHSFLPRWFGWEDAHQLVGNESLAVVRQFPQAAAICSDQGKMEVGVDQGSWNAWVKYTDPPVRMHTACITREELLQLI